MNKNRFQELDVLRGVAALAVVMFHYSGHVTRYFSDFPFHFKLGEYGVQLFFIISGFVIYFSLEKASTLSDFAYSRFSRLYPTYWASLSIWGVVSIGFLGAPIWIGGYVVNATMLQQFIGFSDLDIVYWTLAMELVFYVWMGLIFKAQLLQHMEKIIAGWLGVSFCYGLSLRYGVESSAFLKTYLLAEFIPFFLAGIVFRIAFKQGYQQKNIALLAFCLTDILLIHGDRAAIVAAALFAVIHLGITGKLKWTVNGVTLWLGTISYSLYVTHRNLGYEILSALHGAGIPSTMSVPIVLAASLVIASAVTYGIEKPAMRWLRDKWRFGQQPTGVLSPSTGH